MDETSTTTTALSKPVAVTACLAMAFFYVAILYAPTVVLRLSPPQSLNEFMVRRFICALISSITSLLVSAIILPVRGKDVSDWLSVYGIRPDHIWEAIVYPLCLTGLMYAGSMVLKVLVIVDEWKEHGEFSTDWIRNVLRSSVEWMSSTASNVLAWRNYVVAPLTEEVVFRACMIPLILCGGFRVYNVIFLCPVLFSLAHLNHWMEIYTRQNYSVLKASMVVGLQLGYTVIFGSYASFLFIRTGHFLAPLVAHIFCNFMGLPVLFARRKGIVSLAFVAGMVSFLWLLFPLTNPDLYNDRTTNCRCWHGFCSWN